MGFDSLKSQNRLNQERAKMRDDNGEIRFGFGQYLDVKSVIQLGKIALGLERFLEGPVRLAWGLVLFQSMTSPVGSTSF